MRCRQSLVVEGLRDAARNVVVTDGWLLMGRDMMLLQSCEAAE